MLPSNAAAMRHIRHYASRLLRFVRATPAGSSTGIGARRSVALHPAAVPAAHSVIVEESHAAPASEPSGPKVASNRNLLPGADSMTYQGWGCRNGAQARPADRAGPCPGAAVMRHRLTAATQRGHAAIFGCFVEASGIEGKYLSLSAWIWLPRQFRGTSVSLLGVGFPAVARHPAILEKRDAWQHVSVCVQVPAGTNAISCALSVIGEPDDKIFSSAWQLEHGREPTDYSAAADSTKAGSDSGIIRVAGEPDTLGYLYSPHGLNNQKLALLGLFLAAKAGPIRRVILPDMVVFDQLGGQRTRRPLADVYDLGLLAALAGRHGIEIVGGLPSGEAGGINYFRNAALHLGAQQNGGGLKPNDFACAFVRKLVPLVGRSEAMRCLQQEVFATRGIRIVAQLRIEQDWIAHARYNLGPRLKQPEDYAPSFQQIMAKIKATLEDWQRGIYVVCDEAALPTDKATIRASVRAEFGIDLLWKSDVLSASEISAMDVLDLSMLDFEMAVAAPAFVGLTRSTFSALAAFEALARTRKPVSSHYIYNLPGPLLGRRTDNGALNNPQAACR